MVSTRSGLRSKSGGPGWFKRKGVKEEQGKKKKAPTSRADGKSKLKSPSTQTKIQSQPPGSKEKDVQKTLYTLLQHTKAGLSICPSQIPRRLHEENKAQYPDWRGMMEFTREVVWEEVRRGAVHVTQGGEVRPYEGRGEVRGPIRVIRGERWEERAREFGVGAQEG